MPGLVTGIGAPPQPEPGNALPGNALRGNAKPRNVQPANVNAGQPTGGDESNVSPEEQTQYDEFVTNGMSLLHDEKGLSSLIQSIEGDGNPVEGLANTVASIVIRIEDSAQKQGIEISGDVLMHGGTELLEQAADLAEQSGVHEFSDDELESALYLAMDIYRTTRQQQGKLPTDQLGQDMQELQTAEQDGSLEKQFPGITKYAEKSPAQPPSSEQPPNAQPGNARPRRGLLG